MSKIRNMLFKLLPYELQKQLLRGRISQGADYFLFDHGFLELLKNESYSQHAQDAFIFNMIFGKKMRGVFLDIGANDPIEINNTYLFELHGWTGFAFEPIASLAEKWKDVRKTKCHNVVIGDREGQVKFTESTIKYLSHVGVGSGDENEISYMVPQIRLTDFLNSQGITKADVAFIDVEGYEINVLAGIDFEQTDITCICIESSKGGAIRPRMDIRNYLIDRGYRLVARLYFDDVFLKNSYFEQ